MSKILIFAGTTEGRNLSECLCQAGIYHTICVATEYGEIVLKDSPYAGVHMGRMDQEEIRAFVLSGDYAAVIDATHPYAKIVTDNIRSAMKDMDIPYIRLKRDGTGQAKKDEDILYFDNNEDCLQAIEETSGNILLTTGSKELSVFTSSESLRERLYVRVLPGMESLKLCLDNGITGKQIIAIQGPFSKEMNKAIINQYDIKHLITKISGKTGGYEEKVMAAREAGIKIYAIGCQEEDQGCSFLETLEMLEKISGKSIPKPLPSIILAGIGMGGKDNLTLEVKEAIDKADILLGAKRMIEPYKAKVDKKPYYDEERIIPYLKEMLGSQSELKNIVILFSGDSGFNSGAGKLYKTIDSEIKAGNIKAKLKILPGISSVSYLAAKVGVSYEDALVLSIHGKEVANLANKIKTSKKTYLLMSGLDDLKKLGQLLLNKGLTNIRILAGYKLSYQDEKIMELSPSSCLSVEEEGLYTCLILNDEAKVKAASHGKNDAQFIRDKVPMTKEEVREVSICKLGLKTDSVLYDIGSGTGSIAIEAASLSDDIKVYAFEMKDQALSLIAANKEKFGLDNIEIVEGKAPESLKGKAVPSHAFIGGSSGQMKDILDYLKAVNPNIRVVINAVSIETICEIKNVMKSYSITNDELVQIQVSRANQIGNYNMMQAENPVWVFAFNFA